MSADEAEEIIALRATNEGLRAALLLAESRNQLVLEATNDGVWDWNLTTDEAFFSRRWKGILGYEDHEVGDNGASFFGLVHPDDQGRVEAAVQDHLVRRKPYSIEFRMRAKDGSWREILARGHAEWAEDGTPLRMAGIHTDVTERHERERERLRHQEQISAQADTIRALGVPMLAVWDRVLCLPIIGAVHDDRANNMLTELLDRVTKDAIRFAILDLSAAEFHSRTAETLARMIRTLRMIGTEGVFCGIQPKTAQILAARDLDIVGVPTYRNLGDALRACLERFASDAK